MAARPNGFLARLARLSLPDAGLLVEAVVELAVSAAAIRLLSFRRVGRLASPPLGRARGANPTRVAWAVGAAARRVPWRAVCFQQGLATQIMLRRRGIDSTLWFGASPKAAAGLAAHVWVTAGGMDVIGGQEAPGFAVLARFPATAGAGDAAAAPRRFDAS